MCHSSRGNLFFVFIFCIFLYLPEATIFTVEVIFFPINEDIKVSCSSDNSLITVLNKSSTSSRALKALIAIGSAFSLQFHHLGVQFLHSPYFGQDLLPTFF